MELKATRPAQYSLSPWASSFQTMTMAMQRARPIRISPTMYSGLSARKAIASRNISTGPTIQFWISERPSTFQSLKTRPISSYRTLARGGYIIRISPTAMGMLVVPTENRFQKVAMPGHSQPAPTPDAMARKIHRVR